MEKSYPGVEGADNILVGYNPAPPRKRYIYAPDYDVLGEWAEKNNLYPSRKEKELLAIDSHLKVEQVSSWFDKKRRKTKRLLDSSMKETTLNSNIV